MKEILLTSSLDIFAACAAFSASNSIARTLLTPLPIPPIILSEGQTIESGYKKKSKAAVLNLRR
jgi:hypothetical protein